MSFGMAPSAGALDMSADLSVDMSVDMGAPA